MKMFTTPFQKSKRQDIGLMRIKGKCIELQMRFL